MFYSKRSALPPPASRPAKRRNLVLIAVVVLLGVFVVVGIGLDYFLSGAKAVIGAKVTANRFLSLVEKHKYRAAFNEITYRGESDPTSPDTVRAIVSAQEKRRGKAVSHSSPQRFNVKNPNGVTVVRLVYQEKFANKSEVPVEILLVHPRDTWEIASFKFLP